MSSEQLSVLPPEWIKAADPRTGREVWQVSSTDEWSTATYFEHQSFTSDERYYVFRSTRDGASSLWRCDLQSGELALLTPGETIGIHHFSMHPDGRRCFYSNGSTLRSVDVASGERHTQADFAALGAGASPMGLSMSADGQRIAAGVANPMGMLMVVLDLPQQRLTPVLQWYRFSHPLICPADKDLLTFIPSDDACWKMDWPQHLRTRTWSVRVDEGLPRRFITPPPGRTVTHETWSPDGERMIYFEKAGAAWTPVKIRSVNRFGEDLQTHFETADYRLGHGVLSFDQRYFLSDVQNRGDSPLLRIEMQSGKAEILCWPDASNDGGHAACAHVHAAFSPKANYATFTTDKSGRPRAYVLPLRG
jgi:Tol biopolymer transport system component